MRKIALLFFLLVIFQNSLHAQEVSFAKLDSLFLILEENDRWMGSFSMSHDGKEIYKKSIGYADIANEIPNHKNTKFRVGSISKMFTSVLVFMAAEDGLLTLSDTIEVYFPDVPNAEKITIGNLLNHRSGIFNFTSNPLYLQWSTQPKTREELIEIISETESVFEPNSKAEYSNSNYVLLTFILEDTFKKSYADLVSERIVNPLKLPNTYLGGKTDISTNESYSYKFTDTWKKESETNMSIPLGAGAMVSTPSDLNMFITGLFAEKLISQKSLDQMKTITDGYGKGIFQMPFYDKKGFGHNGGIDGFTSMLGYLPEDQLAFSVTSNGSRINNNDIVIAALSSYFNKPFELPSFQTITVKPEMLKYYVGTYASNDISLKITISHNENGLMAQATGQPSFPLEATAKDTFEFQQAGVRLEFDAENSTMVLKQAGKVYNYTKE
ncbi:serine hydrolase domain-containing protein [Cytophaga sp. FL35]|uniref:serine hydrolase domain-containing protein n=1 Tax=Cytophaga sp. FL35 TaxID=1904456 RepID=UPI0016539E32|nr:serine hydrolase domain-containing protein [Cytophaga sp. FL35]MBC6997241.1 beta-lactamase family protein [Cytophaga sp. FL35]